MALPRSVAGKTTMKISYEKIYSPYSARWQEVGGGTNLQIYEWNEQPVM